MSAGLRGEARVRRVRRDEWGGDMECVWRLWDGSGSAGYLDICSTRVRGWRRRIVL